MAEEKKPQDDRGTDEGYDEAARTGPSRYGVPEGEGGVFGTSGGGSYGGGMQIVERPGVYDRSGEPPAEVSRTSHGRTEEGYDGVTLNDDEKA